MATAEKIVTKSTLAKEEKGTTKQKETKSKETKEKEKEQKAKRTVKTYKIKRRLSNDEVLPETYTGQEKKSFTSKPDVQKVYDAIENARILRGLITHVDPNKAFIEWEGFRGFIPKELLDEKSLKGLIPQLAI